MAIAVGQYGGIAAAFALGGTLLPVAGGGGEGWRGAMQMLTLVLALSLLPCLALREPVRSGVTQITPSIASSFRELWLYAPRIMPLLIGLALIEIALGAILTWTAPILSRHASLSPAAIGNLIGGALAVGGCAGPLLGGFLADFCQRTVGPSRTGVVLAILSLLTAPTGLFVYALNGSVMAFVFGCFAVLSGAVVVMATTLFTIVVPNQLRALCMSIAAGVCVMFGTGVAPVAVSMLASALGGEGLLRPTLVTVCGVAGILASLNYLLFARSVAPDSLRKGAPKHQPAM